MCEYANLALSTDVQTGDPMALDSGFIQVVCTTTHTLDANGMEAVKKGAQASLDATNNYDKSAVAAKLQAKIDSIDQVLS